MTISFADLLRYVTGGAKKEKSVFESEKEAYEFCRDVYEKRGGVTPELRRAYEFYMKNSADGCDQFFGPAPDTHPGTK
jgi:hypothetical protein